MKVLDLQCAQGHRFEAWLASEAEFQAQRDQGLLVCPMCGNNAVEKLLSAPRLNLGNHTQTETAVAVPNDDALVGLQAAWLDLSRKIMATSEDVGMRFTEEARKMHYGEIDERSIRGQASPSQVQALQDEGIAVLPLALPDAVNQRLH